jgi:hypothetical protein
MNMHTDNKPHSVINNMWVQLGLLAIAAVILIALASRYIW